MSASIIFRIVSGQHNTLMSTDLRKLQAKLFRKLQAVFMSGLSTVGLTTVCSKPTEGNISLSTTVGKPIEGKLCDNTNKQWVNPSYYPMDKLA
jgi:hypothetical protein